MRTFKQPLGRNDSFGPGSALTSIGRIAALLVALAAFTGCESTDGGGSVSGSVYYGVGFSDPWYYGGYYDDADIVVTPPDRPDRPDGPHPAHPIARPPASAPRPTPMPSIPSTPRPMPRGGGGRR